MPALPIDHRISFRLLRAVLALHLVLALPALAANLVWNGGVAGAWSEDGTGWLEDGSIPANWNSSTPDNAAFNGVAPLAVSVDSGGVTAGHLTFSAGNYAISGPGTLTLSGSTLDVAGSVSATVSVALAGTSGFTKTGDGTLVLSGTNKAYSGTTLINGGAVQIAGVGANMLGTGSNVTLNGGALHANFVSNSSPAWVFNIGASGGEIRNLGTGRWLMNQAGRITGSGVLTLSYGTNNTRVELNASQSGFNGRWVLKSAGNNNRFFDVYTTFQPGTASGDDVYTFSQASLLLRDGVNLGGASQGISLIDGTSRLAIAGGATSIISGKISGTAGNHLEIRLGSTSSVAVISNTNNSWQGNTALQTDAGSGEVRGTVRFGVSGVFPGNGGNVTIDTGVVLDMNGFDGAIGGLAGSGRILTASGTSELTMGGNNNSPTFTGAITDGGGVLSLIKTGSGTQTLSGTNTYSGSTSVNEGILLLSGQGSIANSDAITVTAGAILSANTRTDGTFTLGAAQRLSGSGTVRGNVTNLGVIATGTDGAGTLIVSGQYAQATSGELWFTITDENTASQMRVANAATLSGALQVTLDGHNPQSGESYELIRAVSRTGTFESEDLPVLDAGLGWTVSYLSTSVVLSVTGAPPVSGFGAWSSAITNGLTNYWESATGDGYPNLLKYATGSSPTVPDDIARVTGAIAAGALNFTFNRNTNAVDVTIIVEQSDNVSNDAVWTGVTTNALGVWNPPVVTEMGAGNPVSATVAGSSAASSGFMRLRVTIP